MKGKLLVLKELRRRSIVLYDNLKLLILNKFGNTKKGSLYAQFYGFWQEGEVEQYCEGFLKLLIPLDGVFDVAALSYFLSGLK